MQRRNFVLGAAGALAAQTSRPLRVGIIGHTGRGNYGHGIDTVWKAIDGAQVVAVADPDEQGREKARVRTGAARAFADYRQMLQEDKFDIVGVCPRWMDQRASMVIAAANAGCHIYCEKAFAATLEEADAMVDAVRRGKVKFQLAHQMRRSPFTLMVKAMLEAGEIGDIQEIRCRGKEDKRAGGEDLMVLGSHLCDVMRTLAGDPQWVFAHVTESGAAISRRHVREGTEPIGPIAGREIGAMFGFAGGLHAYMASKATKDTHDLRFGTFIYGSKGVIFLPNANYPNGAQSYILRSPAWIPGKGAEWKPIEVEHDHRFEKEAMMTANLRMVEDLREAIKNDREPTCSERAGLWTTEMITGIYRSQLEGLPVKFPQVVRKPHPLAELK